MKISSMTALIVCAILVAFTSGCSQEVSHSESSKPGWFGGRTTQESTTVRNADGSISTESSSKTTHEAPRPNLLDVVLLSSHRIPRLYSGVYRINRMVIHPPSMAQQIAAVVMDFQLKTTGRAPKAVTVVLSLDTLVVTLHDALSPAEKVLAESPEGAAQVQEFHRQLFAYSCQPLREEIHRITGVAVREAVTQVEPAWGAVVQAFTSNATVKLFRMAQLVAHESWSSSSAQDFIATAALKFPPTAFSN